MTENQYPEKAMFSIRAAVENDVSLILQFIIELSEYEKLRHEVVATEEKLHESLFEKKMAEVLIAEFGNEPVGFALFFHNYSTFLGQPGIYLEDLYIKPEMRSKGFGKLLFRHVAKLAAERNCGRFEWACLNWNEPAIEFYTKQGAIPQNYWTVYRLTSEKLKDF